LHILQLLHLVSFILPLHNSFDVDWLGNVFLCQLKVFISSGPHFRSIEELNETGLVLEKLYLHSDNLNVMNQLQIVADLVTLLQTKCAWTIYHQFFLIKNIILLVVELNLAFEFGAH